MSGNPFLDLSEQLEQMIELAAGHKQRAIDAGFSPEHAEEMGVSLYHALVTGIIGNAAKKGKS